MIPQKKRVEKELGFFHKEKAPKLRRKKAQKCARSSGRSRAYMHAAKPGHDILSQLLPSITSLQTSSPQS